MRSVYSGLRRLRGKLSQVEDVNGSAILKVASGPQRKLLHCGDVQFTRPRLFVGNEAALGYACSAEQVVSGHGQNPALDLLVARAGGVVRYFPLGIIDV